MTSCSVVVDNIQQYRDTLLMAFVNELFIFLFRSICLVHCKIITRIIAPTIISVELLYRHKFNCIHSQALDVIQMLRSFFNGTGGKFGTCLREVAEQQFVYYHIIRIFNLEVGYLPVVGCRFCLEYGDNTCCLSIRILYGTGRINSLFYKIFIVRAIQDLFTVRVADTDIAVCFAAHIILEAILFGRVNACNRIPPEVFVVIALHLIFCAEFPIIEVANQASIILIIVIRIQVV